MRPLNLPACDLNLLVVFEALYEERHVTRAGTKIGLSQSSVSQALKRLRDLFEDQLFTRGQDGMSPTARTEELARGILPALGQLRGVLNDGAGFNAGTSRRNFVVGLNDLGSFRVLPRLAPLLRAQAPSVNLTIRNVGSKDAVDRLLSGAVELACGVFYDLPPTVESHRLTSLKSVCIADRRNPRLKRRTMDLKTFLELPHVQVAVNADPGNAIDAILSALSLRRHVAVSVPHFLAVPGAIVGTDMIAVVDTQALEAFKGWKDLRVDPVPIPFPDIAVSMIWNRRNEHDAGHRWLRELVSACITDDKPSDEFQLNLQTPSTQARANEP